MLFVSVGKDSLQIHTFKEDSLEERGELRLIMVKIGDIVSYGTQGVCRVEDFTERRFGGMTMEYVVLSPIYDENATIFVPVKNEKLMNGLHRLVSVEDIHGMMNVVSEEAESWISDENARKGRYKEILDRNDRQEMLKMMRLLYLRRNRLQGVGKKLHVCDERFLKEAEKLILDEFSLVLKMKRENILPYLFKKTEKAE